MDYLKKMPEIYERIASLGNASIAYVLKQLPQYNLNRSLVYRIQLEIKKRNEAQNVYNALSKDDPKYKEAVNICKQPNRYNGFPYCGRGRPPASHIIKRNRLIFSEITNGHIHTRGSLCGTLNMFKAKIQGRTYNWKQKKPNSMYPPASVSRILIKTFHIPLERIMVPVNRDKHKQKCNFLLKIRHTHYTFLQKHTEIGLLLSSWAIESLIRASITSFQYMTLQNLILNPRSVLFAKDLLKHIQKQRVFPC